MSLFDEIPEPTRQIPYLPSEADAATQMRLSIVESTFETAARACRALEEAINRGEYSFRSACVAYAYVNEQVETAIAEWKSLTEEHGSVGRK